MTAMAKDYISPGMEVVRPDACFPNMTAGNEQALSWKYLRKDVPHTWYVDRRAPHIGFLNRDEAHILYNTGLRFRGRGALEIGCWMGWSACHLALAGVRLDVIDPVLAQGDFLESVRQSLQAAGVLSSVNLAAGFSPSQVDNLCGGSDRKWALFFIDGNHEAPYPVFDAAVCAEHAEQDALILFHDLASPDVAQGLEYLRQRGWNTMVYMTAQIMGVGWRGNVEPVQHVPDPDVSWNVPDHLKSFVICGPVGAEMLDRALQHHRAGRVQEAEALYRQILQAQPRHPNALHLLGLIAHQVGQHGAAVDLISQAIAVNPAAAEFHNDLGEACRALGRLEDAEASYHRALALKPGLAEAHYNLGLMYGDLGRLDDAANNYQCALESDPANAAAHNNLGNVLKAQGRIDEAVEHYRQALALKPDFAEAHNNLGTVFQGLGMVQEAIECFRQALALKPDYIEALNNLGNAFIDGGAVKEAMASYRQALTIKPDCADAHSNVLLAMNYDSSFTPEAIAAEHVAWGDRHARPLAVAILPHTNDCDPDRRLRVGYVSTDYHRHSVMYFFEPLLAAHDRVNVEVFCYSAGARSDEVTDRLRTEADAWRNIAGRNDDAVVKLIHDDRIDILVDLSGHTAHNRLLVFARKPAPVQVTYLGYGTTTGLSTMDYRLTDQYLSPPYGPEWFSEELVRLPGCYVCYGPPAEAPPVSPPPAAKNGFVTFGSFNNLAKATPEVVSLWAEILRLLPTAKLLLKDRTLADKDQQARYRSSFAKEGIGADRIEFAPKVAGLSEHLACYGRIDIGLDPFPYNGCTTTCEALWMGVPVIILAGRMSHGRYGLSLLSALEMDELIATSPRAYVEKAVSLANDSERLARLRSTLRPRVVAASLCDAKSFARGVERAYRMMWGIYARGESPRAFEVSP
jgi:predicted O-linked N-acetylglucosamine transferase (SPINDLY family)